MCRPSLRPMKPRWRRIRRIRPRWSTEATVFENHKLTANALDAYYKLREQWPDAVWVKSKIFDLEQTLARSGGCGDGCGASRRADLRAAGGHLEIRASRSCRCNSPTRTPACSASCWRARAAAACRRDNVLLLTDEKATTAAVRNGFQDFLKRRAGQERHGGDPDRRARHRGVPGSKNAFILTYDSDPQDLNSTALPHGRAAIAVRGAAQQSRPRAAVRGCLQGRNHRDHSQHHG